jgi:hypothetical protein
LRLKFRGFFFPASKRKREIERGREREGEKGRERERGR